MTTLTTTRAAKARTTGLAALVRAGVLLLVLGASFFAGKFLGHLHFGSDASLAATSISRNPFGNMHGNPDASGGTRLLAELMKPNSAGLPSAGSARTDAASEPGIHHKLRLRPVAGIHSSQARDGGRVSFLTTEDFEDAAGRQVPAGSRVEGIITPRGASGEPGAEWVIEIHSLHVGTQALLVRALPLASFQPMKNNDSGQKLRDPRTEVAAPLQLRPLNPLQQIPDLALPGQGNRPDRGAVMPIPVGPQPEPRPDPVEAGDLVVPSGAILEFELIRLPGQSVGSPVMDKAQPPKGQEEVPAVRPPESRPAEPTRPWAPMPRPRSARA